MQYKRLGSTTYGADGEKITRYMREYFYHNGEVCGCGGDGCDRCAPPNDLTKLGSSVMSALTETKNGWRVDEAIYVTVCGCRYYLPIGTCLTCLCPIEWQKCDSTAEKSPIFPDQTLTQDGEIPQGTLTIDNTGTTHDPSCTPLTYSRAVFNAETGQPMPIATAALVDNGDGTADLPLTVAIVSEYVGTGGNGSEKLKIVTTITDNCGNTSEIISIAYPQTGESTTLPPTCDCLIVSQQPGNAITVGADGGAYLAIAAATGVTLTLNNDGQYEDADGNVYGADPAVALQAAIDANPPGTEVVVISPPDAEPVVAVLTGPNGDGEWTYSGATHPNLDAAIAAAQAAGANEFVTNPSAAVAVPLTGDYADEAAVQAAADAALAGLPLDSCTVGDDGCYEYVFTKFASGIKRTSREWILPRFEKVGLGNTITFDSIAAGTDLGTDYIELDRHEYTNQTNCPVYATFTAFFKVASDSVQTPPALPENESFAATFRGRLRSNLPSIHGGLTFGLESTLKDDGVNLSFFGDNSGPNIKNTDDELHMMRYTARVLPGQTFIVVQEYVERRLIATGNFDIGYLAGFFHRQLDIEYIGG